MCENVNCVLIVSPLNATLYYVLPHRKFPEAFGAQVFRHRHQEVITKVDETVTCKLKFIYGQAVVLWKIL